MCELPHGYRLMAPAMKADLGARALWAFVRCIEPNPDEQRRLYQGDILHHSAGHKSFDQLIRVSEPFDDSNGDWVRGDAEPYLDYDRNGRFTLDQVVVDQPDGKLGSRDVGLVDCYWLSSWRTIRVLHAPEILTKPMIDPPRGWTPTDVLVRIESRDADEGDKLRYRFKKNMDDDERLFVIDSDTGDIRLHAYVGRPPQCRLQFIVEVVDRSGLMDSRKFTVMFRGVVTSESVGDATK